MNLAPFGRLRQDLRLWLAGLINRKEIVNAFAKDAGRVAESPFTPLAAGYTFKLIKPLAQQLPFLPDNSEKKYPSCFTGD